MKSIFWRGSPAGDGVFFLLGAEVGGKQVAGGVGAGVLGEMDEIDWRAALFVELGDLFLELGGGVNGVIALGLTRVLSFSSDINAEGVGAADDFEEAAGGELFD